MCCTFGDKSDVAWFKKHNLPYKGMIGHDGKFIAQAGILAGLTIKDARIKVIEELIAKTCSAAKRRLFIQLIFMNAAKKRSNILLSINGSFSILHLKKEILAMADRIDWYPAS